MFDDRLQKPGGAFDPAARLKRAPGGVDEVPSAVKVSGSSSISFRPIVSFVQASASTSRSPWRVMMTIA